MERRRPKFLKMAGATGLEPAASGVTGRRSNQLSYAPFLGVRPLKPHVAASQGNAKDRAARKTAETR